MIALPTSGFHYGVAYEEYAQWPAINFSKLKPIRDTASKCKHAIDNPRKPTPARVLGQAFHVAVLEPARFEQLFYICPPCDRRTAEGKDIFAKAEQAAGTRLMIRSGSKEDEGLLNEVKTLQDMARAVHAFKAAGMLLHGAGQNEVSAIWQDQETGLMCKGRFDRFIPEFERLEGQPVIVEIKTTKDAAEWAFAKDCDVMGYAAQAASYRHAVLTITGKSPVHSFIATEKEAPYDLAVYQLDDQSLQTGWLQYRQMLKRYAECVKSNQWPGYPDAFQVLSLPKYANERNYAE